MGTPIIARLCGFILVMHREMLLQFCATTTASDSCCVVPAMVASGSPATAYGSGCGSPVPPGVADANIHPTKGKVEGEQLLNCMY